MPPRREAVFKDFDEDDFFDITDDLLLLLVEDPERELVLFLDLTCGIV